MKDATPNTQCTSACGNDYPPALLDRIFGGSGEIDISDSDVVSKNGVHLKKNDLALQVVNALTPDTEMHPEFVEKFLKLLEEKFQLTTA